MIVADKNVLPKVRLEKERVRDLLALGWARTVAKHGRVPFANHLNVHVDTVKNALGGDHSPEIHTALNSLGFDHLALDDLMEAYGLRVVPRDQADAGCSSATLPLLAAVHKVAEAEADGAIDHAELLAMEGELREAASIIARLLTRVSGLRAAA
jgi:hypothetical protein